MLLRLLFVVKILAIVTTATRLKVAAKLHPDARQPRDDSVGFGVKFFARPEGAISAYFRGEKIRNEVHVKGEGWQFEARRSWKGHTPITGVQSTPSGIHYAFQEVICRSLQWQHLVIFELCLVRYGIFFVVSDMGYVVIVTFDIFQ